MIATWDVSGRRVLVTGASSGLGLAMAQALAHAGARVALGGRDDDRLAHALATIDDPAGDVRPVQVDVRDAASITRAITTLDDVWGGLDVLVNNAGLGMRTVNPAFLSDPQPFWRVPRGRVHGRHRHQPDRLLPRRRRRRSALLA